MRGFAPPVARKKNVLAWPSLLAIAVVLAGGLALSIGGYALDRIVERRQLSDDLQRRVNDLTELLQGKIARSTEVLHSIASLFHAQDGKVSRSEFNQFVQSALLRQPELLALSWTPRVPQAAKSTFEQFAQADGLNNFRFLEQDASDHYVPVGQREEYWPIYYIAPTQRNEVALGFDLHSDPARSAALDAARDRGTSVATAPIKLVQDRGHEGFIVFLPLFTAPNPQTIELRRDTLIGYTAAVFRVDDLVKSSFAQIESGIDATLEDRTGGAAPLFHQSSTGNSPPLNKLQSSAGFDLAGRRWNVSLRPTQQYVAAHTSSRPWFVFASGLAITGLLAAYMGNSLRQRTEIERQVRERTAALSNEIAARRRAEISASEAEQKYRSIFENCIDGIFQTTLDGKYLSVNPALTRIYGYQHPQELICALSDIGRQLYVQPHRRAEFIQAVQHDAMVAGFESQIYRRDGSIIWISENARAVRDADGRLLYYEGIVEDITARKLAQENLRRANDELEERVRQRTAELASSNQALRLEAVTREAAERRAQAANRAKSTFLANMSHEIRTPMNAIIGYAQILRRDASLNAPQREAIETIVAGGDHLLNLIDDLLDLSKIEAGRTELRPVAFELGSLVKDVTSLFGQRCAEKGIKLSARMHPQTPQHVCGDEGKLRQVLINLLGNAVKYTDQGQVTLRVESAGDAVFQFEVTDTGNGIAPSMIENIFEPFQQGDGGESKGGTGLGLAIAKRHVALLGGELCVASTVGGGSTFYFTANLSAAISPQDRIERASLAVSEHLNGKVTALVVDDVAANRNVLSHMLRVIGCEVLVADSGEQAIAIALRDAPDIIFTDISMPRINGADAASIIRTRCPATRIIAVSALSASDARIASGAFDGFLPKPVRFEKLQSLVLNQGEAEISQPNFQIENNFNEPVKVPVQLLEKMLRSAEIGSVSEIKLCAQRLESLGPVQAKLAERIFSYLRSFDTDRVLAALNSEHVHAENFTQGNGPLPSEI